MFECFDGIKNFFEESALELNAGLYDITHGHAESSSSNTSDSSNAHTCEVIKRMRQSSKKKSESFTDVFRYMRPKAEDKGSSNENYKDEVLDLIRDQLSPVVGDKMTEELIDGFRSLSYDDLKKLSEEKASISDFDESILANIKISLGSMVQLMEAMSKEKNADVSVQDSDDTAAEAEQGQPKEDDKKAEAKRPRKTKKQTSGPKTDPEEDVRKMAESAKLGDVVVSQ